MRIKLFLLLIPYLLIAACTLDKLHINELDCPIPITIDLEINQVGECKVPCTISFENNSENATSFLWDFGDGTNSDIGSLDKIYDKAGDYDVVLTASNDECEVNTIRRVTVNKNTFSNNFGFDDRDWGKAVLQNEDGGFTLLGFTGAGQTNMFLVLTDKNGEIEGAPISFGGNNSERGQALVRASDGGLFLIGDGDNLNSQDIYVVFADKDGNEKDIISPKYYGGDFYESANDGILTADNRLAIIGSTSSYGNGNIDVIMLLLTEWGFDPNQDDALTFGGTENDIGRSIIERNNGGFAILGDTNSFGDGDTDFYLILTDENGNDLNPNNPITFGSTESNIASSIVELSNGNLAIIGSQGSQTCIVLTDENGNDLNPNNPLLFGDGPESGTSIIETEDNKICFISNSQSQQIFLRFTDLNGDRIESLDREFGGNGQDTASEIIQTKDCGFAIAAATNSFGNGEMDFLLIKTDDQGNLQ